MSGGRFLVSLREVESSEKIISIKSLIKETLALNEWFYNEEPVNKDAEELEAALLLLQNEIEE